MKFKKIIYKQVFVVYFKFIYYIISFHKKKLSLIITNMEKNNIWDKYEKQKLLGSLGYSRIFKSMNKLNRKKVLIKEYPKDIIKETKTNLRNYKLKTRIPVLEMIEGKDDFYIVIELGLTDLKKYLDERVEGFSAYNIKKILTQLNDDFKIMQKEKLIRGILEPSDIIIFINDIDFTFKLSNYYSFSFNIYRGNELSSPSYNFLFAAPEILTGEQNITFKSDIWSLGIVIYYMTFKEYPYKGRNEFLLYKDILSNKTLKKNNDDDLNDLISKMLKVNINERISWNDYFNHPFFKKQFPEEAINQGKDILLTIKEQVNDIHKNIDINILKLGYETQIEKLKLELKNLKQNNQVEDDLKKQIKKKDEIIKQIRNELEGKIKENKEINKNLRIVTEKYQDLKRKYDNK